jgi:hypothetical protein
MESAMKTFTRVVLILTTAALPFLMSGCTGFAERKVVPGGSPPVITNSFASKEVAQGQFWRIYLEAQDPDSDMQKIVCFIQQPGSGMSSQSVSIRKGDEARLFGILACYFSPARPGVSAWTELTLTLFIRDRGGNESNRVTFPVAVSLRARQEPPSPPFDPGVMRIFGGIGITLFSPTE